MSATASLRLELIDGDGTGIDLPDQGLIVVGSAADRSAFVVAGAGIDGAHCAIGRVRPGGFAIKDLGSRGGTFVNGSRVTSARLVSGDVIAIGARRLRVYDPSSEAKNASKPARKGPARLAGYRIERLVGRGGMGEVYLAVQESLNRPVALKILSGELAADRDFVRRFQSEARAAAALSHPNVVVVYDVGEDSGLHYLSMEYMPLGSLEQRVAAGGPIPWREALDVLRDAAAGLSYAESKGIVHRDIKPANLMLSASGAVKIADLGLATWISSSDESSAPERSSISPTERSSASQERKALGTPHFVSPEQARGESLDHRSDLYSLGATAYRMLSGRTPFEGASTREILRARFQTDPIPLRTLVSDLPAALEAVVQKLMARDPDERYPSADALARELDRIRLEADHGPSSRAPSSLRLSQLLVGLLLLLMLGSGLAYLALPSIRGTSAYPHDPNGFARERDSAEDEAFFDVPALPSADDADERALDVLELEAKLAYHEIPTTLAPAERVEALRSLAERFAPTTTASSARDEIARLEGEARLGSLETERMEQGLVEALAELRQAISWPPPAGELPRPFDHLRALASFAPPIDLAVAGRFEEARALLEQEILAVSERAARETLTRADEHAARGEFSEVRSLLAPLVERYEVSASDALQTAALRDLGATARTRLEHLDEEEQAFERRIAQRDRLQLAQAVGPRSPLLREIGTLDLAAVERRLAALEPTLATETARRTSLELLEELSSARGALDLLVETFRSGAWRRFSVALPGKGRSSVRDVVGASAEGLLLAGEGGTEEAPWSLLLSNTAGIDQLFRSRLNRSYTPAEHDRILSLLRLVAASEGASLAAQALDPEGNRLLPPADAAALAAVFDFPLAWVAEARAEGAGRKGAELARESEAAELLAQALNASQEESWTLAVANVERLLRDFGDTFLVLFLSDGSLTAEEEAAEASAGGQEDSAEGG